MRHENRLDAGIVCSDHFSVAVVVTEKREMSVDMNRNIVTGSPLRNAAAILLADALTETATETGPLTEMISVTDAVSENPVKRKRGRPPKDGEAMTAAERSRRYRRKKLPALKKRRVEVCGSTFARAEKIAAESGVSLDLVFYAALLKAPLHLASELKAVRMKVESTAAAAHENGA